MSTQPPEFGEDDLSDLSEEELRAAYEAEIARVRVEDVLVQTVVSLLNLAARKAGLTGAEEEPDFEQVRQAIDATTALLPLVEPTLGPGRQAGPRRALAAAARLRALGRRAAAGRSARRRARAAREQPARRQRALGARAVGASAVRPVSMRARLSPLGASHTCAAMAGSAVPKIYGGRFP